MNPRSFLIVVASLVVSGAFLLALFELDFYTDRILAIIAILVSVLPLYHDLSTRDKEKESVVSIIGIPRVKENPLRVRLSGMYISMLGVCCTVSACFSTYYVLFVYEWLDEFYRFAHEIALGEVFIYTLFGSFFGFAIYLSVFLFLLYTFQPTTYSNPTMVATVKGICVGALSGAFAGCIAGSAAGLLFGSREHLPFPDAHHIVIMLGLVIFTIHFATLISMRDITTSLLASVTLVGLYLPLIGGAVYAMIFTGTLSSIAFNFVISTVETRMWGGAEAGGLVGGVIGSTFGVSAVSVVAISRVRVVAKTRFRRWL